MEPPLLLTVATVTGYMEEVLVTGGLGESGRWIIDELVSNGYQVTSLDQVRPDWDTASSYYDIDFREIDLTNGGEVFEIIHEINPDAVVHWGAYPSPLQSAGGRVFTNNTESTYHILTAAGQCSADVVLASSEAVYGYAFADTPSVPAELPITTTEPMQPADAYGLSKMMAEETGKATMRQYNIQVTALRPAWIQYPGKYDCLEIQSAPEYGKPHFWAYCDIRDLKCAVRHAVERDANGFEAFHVMAADNYMGQPTAELVEREFDASPEVVGVSGEETAYSLEKSKEVLGWSPEHSWRTAAEDQVESPLIDV